MQMFQDYPFGVGYKNYQYVSPRYLDPSYLTAGKRSSHNSFFAVLCDLGVLGFVPWAAAIILSLIALRRVRKRANWGDSQPLAVYAMALEIGLYGWLATGLTDDTSGLDPVYWFMALAVVVTRLSHQHSKESTSTDTIEDPGMSLEDAAVGSAGTCSAPAHHNCTLGSERWGLTISL
jgi:O-antigen ligase